ncbi:Cas9 inhibitor AcrIIA9 family protein [Parablautia intestinalis]|uniref:Cas9 inhibitor AcrIIA9 family protein n=1 Tax=Parablautia intestinalis TaxID=2320100 RepID=UPI002412829D|nr:Cas9 inhibitor AcrIIA9 family protein [Parablautia intestinalis]
MALENEPEQDFLGKMYMNLNLGNHWKGQFFTPYTVCKMMSQMTLGNADRQIEEQGYISICDPACGAGANLIATANTMKSSKYNFQNHVLFVGQDVDRVVAQMCYIQLSLLGCAGYICVGNTLTNPLTGPVLFPRENEGQEMWYMPMFQSDVWQMRKIFHSLGSMGGTVTTEKTVEKEHFYMFFNFDKKEASMESKEIKNGNLCLSANKTETVKPYSSGEEKLIAEEDEMIASVKPEFKKIMQAQMDLIFKELISWTKQDPEFEKRVLLNYKSMKRCMKFCADKAMGLREPPAQEKAAARNNNIPIMTPVGSDMLFEWIKEYYDKDDKAEVEKEKKVAAAQKKTVGKKKSEPKETVSKKQEKKPVENKEGTKAARTPKNQDKFVNKQISMFDLFDDLLGVKGGQHD